MKVAYDHDDEPIISLTQEEEDSIVKAMEICQKAYETLKDIDGGVALESSFYDAFTALEDVYQNNEGA